MGEKELLKVGRIRAAAPKLFIARKKDVPLSIAEALAGVTEALGV